MENYKFTTLYGPKVIGHMFYDDDATHALYTLYDKDGKLVACNLQAMKPGINLIN